LSQYSQLDELSLGSLLRMMRTVAGIMRMYDARIVQSSMPMVAFWMRHRAMKRPPTQNAVKITKNMASPTV
jgi:KaiC/GvpD/RAD55 family RecA-like ATPase